MQRAESAILICDERIDGSLIWKVADVFDEPLEHFWNRLDPNDLKSIHGVHIALGAIVGANINHTAGFF